jgi:tRNA(fMet)-specific endonuclease VapC
MLDTTVLVDLLRGRSAPSRERFRAASGHLAVSSISVMEIEYGVVRSSNPAANRQAADALLSMLDILPFDEPAAREAGHVRHHLAASGRTIGPFDALIAGHARSASLVLVTNNLREFSRVPDLTVENWFQS